MKKEYLDLEGKEITWVRSDGKEYTGIVVGCDFDIGITIVDKNNKDRNLTCLNGPMSPNNHQYRQRAYKSFFYSAVSMIRKGKYNSRITDLLWDMKLFGTRASCTGGMASCAFS